LPAADRDRGLAPQLYNLHRVKHGFTNEERAGLEAHISVGFTDTFRIFTPGGENYTWWAPFRNARERNVGWRIDYIFVSNRLVPRVTSARIHAGILGSDHCPVSIEIKN